MAKISYIRFDWAVKKILRDKANFGVLEGLIKILRDDRNPPFTKSNSRTPHKRQPTHVSYMKLSL